MTSSKIIDHFKKSDPLLFEALLKVQDLHGEKLFELKKSDNLFYELCESIVSQQLSVKAGDTIFNRVLDLMPKRILSPENLLKTDRDKLRGAGLSRSKVEYICDLAQKVMDKVIDLESLDKLNNDGVIAELTKVKGIGRWTAEMFLMFALGRPDIFSHGDLGLRNAIKRLYSLEAYETAKVDEIIVRWSPYKTYACRILWRSLNL